jgi:hypothetical protein
MIKASPIIFAEPVTDSKYPNEPVPLTDILLKFCVPVNELFISVFANDAVVCAVATPFVLPNQPYPSVIFGKAFTLMYLRSLIYH